MGKNWKLPSLGLVHIEVGRRAGGKDAGIRREHCQFALIRCTAHEGSHKHNVYCYNRYCTQFKAFQQMMEETIEIRGPLLQGPQ